MLTGAYRAAINKKHTLFYRSCEHRFDGVNLLLKRVSY